MSEVADWAENNQNIFWIDKTPWVKEGAFLIPLNMPHAVAEVDRSKVKQVLKESGALVARWVAKWDCEETGWWYTCCDQKDYDLPLISSSRGKRGIKKGLKNCTVRRVKVKEFIEKAYPIYSNALISYGEPSPSKEEYKKEILSKSNYKGCEYWGAFVEEEMIAFSTCIVLDNSVSLGSTKSNPDFNKISPNNALFYEITKYYLTERGLGYVSNGSRTLLHPTTINDFLIRMNFRKIYCQLNVELSSIAKFVYLSKIGVWGKLFGLSVFLPKKWKMLSGFNQLVEVSKGKH